MKKILITGAGGFIGSHLTQTLIKKGFNVTALFRYNSSNSKGWLDLDKDETDGNYESKFCDLGDSNLISQLIKNKDVVVHLAALIGIPYSYQARESYLKTNITGTFNILEACLKNNISNLIHTSTSEVYGTPKKIPITEKNELQPQSPYAASKVGADQLAMSYFKSFQLPLTILRPFNNFGPRQSNRAVIPTIINQVLKKNCKEIKIGSTKPTRDFLYVDDMAAASIHIMNLDYKKYLLHTDQMLSHVNVGTGIDCSIKELAEMIADVTGFKGELIFDSSKPDGTPRKLMDVSRLKQLGWQSSTSLKNGLKETYSWFKTNTEEIRSK